MQAIEAELHERREILKKTRLEIAALEEWFSEEEKKNEFWRKFFRQEKAWVKSLPTIKRIRKNKKAIDCPICLEDMRSKDTPMFRTRLSYTGRIGQTVNCLHKFHLGCIEEWLQNSLTCPVCRSPVPEEGGIDIADA